MINLYTMNGAHYYNDLNKPCNACNEIIVDTIIVKEYWDKLGSGINYFCVKCAGKLKESNKISYIATWTATITEDIPIKAMPAAFTKPTFSAVRSNLDIADIEALGGETIDNTVYANRKEPLVKEYVIEDAKEDIDLKLGFKPLKDDELDSLFSSHKNAKAITKEDRRLLE